METSTTGLDTKLTECETEINTLTAEEERIMDAVVRLYKHPSYDRALDAILECNGTDAWAEYSTYAHDEIAEMVGSRFGHQACRIAGDQIGKRGGLQAMQGVYYGMLCVLGDAVGEIYLAGEINKPQTVTFMNTARALVDFAWRGLHGWEC